MNEKHSDWDQLATTAQSGDKQAYHALLKQLIPYIQKIIAPGLANSDWVDDLLQDILLGIHKSLARYMPGQPFRPWVNAIIRYRRAEFLSRYYTSMGHMKAPLDETIAEVRDPLAQFQSNEDLERMLSHFTEQQRSVFKMVRIEGHSVKAVAEKTGLSISAVKVSAHRTAAKLKEMLRQQN